MHTPVTWAIVIKGPLANFTRSALRFYLEQERDAHSNKTVVVFSHNTGCLSRSVLEFLQRLREQHPHRFDYSLRPPPPALGVGYRNSQREATYFGTRLAIARWAPQFVLLHRPDGGFFRLSQTTGQSTDLVSTMLRRLEMARASWPPPTSGPQQGRLAFCPTQIHLTDFYGQYHLDDYCVYGHAADVLRFATLQAPGYCRSCPASTTLLPKVLERRTGHRCQLPGPESENGQLWVRALAADDETWRPPRSTLELVLSQTVILNAYALGYVRYGNKELEEGVTFPFANTSLPAITQYSEQFGFKRRSRGTMFSLATQCIPPTSERAESLTYNCTWLSDPSLDSQILRREPAKDWDCPDPSAPSMQLKWKSACAPDRDLGDLLKREKQHADAQTRLVAAPPTAPAQTTSKREQALKRAPKSR